MLKTTAIIFAALMFTVYGILKLGRLLEHTEKELASKRELEKELNAVKHARFLYKRETIKLINENVELADFLFENAPSLFKTNGINLIWNLEYREEILLRKLLESSSDDPEQKKRLLKSARCPHNQFAKIRKILDLKEHNHLEEFYQSLKVNKETDNEK